MLKGSPLFCCVSSQHPRAANHLDTASLKQSVSSFAERPQVRALNISYPTSDWNIPATANTDPSQPTHAPSQTCTKPIYKWVTGQKLLIKIIWQTLSNETLKNTAPPCQAFHMPPNQIHLIN